MELRNYIYVHQQELSVHRVEMEEAGIWPTFEDESPFWFERECYLRTRETSGLLI